MTHFLKQPCSACGMDLLGFRICVGDDESIIIMCEECNSIWIDPDLKDGPYASTFPDWLCPDGERTMASPKSYWATKDQLETAGLWHYVNHSHEPPS